jgi:hypothetical protein
MTVTDRHSLAPAMANRSHTTDGSQVQLAAKAASGAFSSSVITDLDGYRLSPRWLPLEASIKRGQMTEEELSRADAHLLAGAETSSLFQMAKALDDGADINAVKLSGRCWTALQIATNTRMGCSAVRFLLHYQNVNLHVRDGQGGNLLHIAVRVECEECIRSLLGVGLSMTDEDENGISALNFAAESCRTTRPLLTLLRHARDNAGEDNAITALDPHVLYKLCCKTSMREEHAHVLVSFGWSLVTHMTTKTSHLLLDTLEKEHWLLEEILEHPEAIVQIREGYLMWDAVLRAVTRGPVTNSAIALRLICAGIKYRHLMADLIELADKERNHSLLEHLRQQNTEWCRRKFGWAAELSPPDTRSSKTKCVCDQCVVPCTHIHPTMQERRPTSNTEEAFFKLLMLIG